MNDINSTELRRISLEKIMFVISHARVTRADDHFIRQYITWLERNPNSSVEALQINILRLYQRLDEICLRELNRWEE